MLAGNESVGPLDDEAPVFAHWPRTAYEANACGAAYQASGCLKHSLARLTSKPGVYLRCISYSHTWCISGPALERVPTRRSPRPSAVPARVARRWGYRRSFFPRSIRIPWPGEDGEGRWKKPGAGYRRGRETLFARPPEEGASRCSQGGRTAWRTQVEPAMTLGPASQRTSDAGESWAHQRFVFHRVMKGLAGRAMRRLHGEKGQVARVVVSYREASLVIRYATFGSSGMLDAQWDECRDCPARDRGVVLIDRGRRRCGDSDNARGVRCAGVAQGWRKMGGGG